MEILIYSALAYLIMTAANKDVKRGIRNNNPGNIRINNANDWLGKVPVEKNSDGEYEQFVAPQYGVRAIGKLLRTYRRNGFDTIEEIITRYAPEVDNNHTTNYINFVSGQTGIPKWQTLYDFNIPAVTAAIIHFENGEQPYSEDFIQKSLEL